MKTSVLVLLILVLLLTSCAPNQQIGSVINTQLPGVAEETQQMVTPQAPLSTLEVQNNPSIVGQTQETSAPPAAQQIEAAESTPLVTETVQENRSSQERWSINRVSDSWDDPLGDSNLNEYLLPIVHLPQVNKGIFYDRGYYYDDKTVYSIISDSQSSFVASFDFTNGQLQWQSEIDGFILGVGNETVFVLTEDDRIYGLNKDTGEVKWKIFLKLLFDEQDYFEIHEMILNDGDGYKLPIRNIKGNEYTNYLMLINETSGVNSLIPVDYNENSELTPYVYFDGLLITKDRDNDRFVAVNLTDGSIRWSLDLPKYWEIFHVDLINHVIYVLDKSFGTTIDLLAIDITSGENIWGEGLATKNNLIKDEWDTFLFNGYGIALTDKYVVAEGQWWEISESKTFVFDKKTGLLLNSIPTTRSNKAYYAEDGLIVFYDELGVLQGIDYLTGEILWEDDEAQDWDPGADFVSGPDYRFHKDVIFFLNHEAINQRTGELLWTTSGDIEFGFYQDYVFQNTRNGFTLSDIYSGKSEAIPLSKGWKTLGERKWIDVINENTFLLIDDYLTLIDVVR